MSGSPPRATRAYVQRPRRVPPELARDEMLELGCSERAALLLYRLIAGGDDQGRWPGDPRYLRSVLFGMRDSVTSRKVETALGELVDGGFVIAYEDSNGRKLVQVSRWWEYQGPWARRAYASSYPPPRGWTDQVFDKPSQRGRDGDEDAAGDDDDAGELPAATLQDAGKLPADAGNGAAPSTSTSTSTSTVTPPVTGTITDTGTVVTAPPRRGGLHGASSTPGANGAAGRPFR